MERIDRIFNNTVYKKHLHSIEKYEQDRIYCRHNVDHFLDVARIALILAAEEGVCVQKDMVYAASLLHDIGRDRQYEDGTAHETASAELAQDILRKSGFSEGETKAITEAIREHGNEAVMTRRDIVGLLYRADKLSRKCYCCNAQDTCHKAEYKRNTHIKY